MKKWYVYTLLAVLWWNVNSSAQGISSNYLNRKLDNGLQLLLIEDYSKPLITLNVIFKEGPLYLNEQEYGLNLLSSMMFLSSSQAYPSLDLIDNTMRRLKVSYDNHWYESAQTHQFRYYRGYTDSILHLLSDVILHPVISAEELNRGKKSYDSLLSSFQQQSDYLLLERRNQLLEKYGLEKLNIIGSTQTIQKCTVQQFMDYRNKFIKPSNCLIIVHGRFNKFEMISKLNQYFGNWTQTGPSITEKNIRVQLPFSTQTLVGTPLAQYPILQYCFPGPSYKTNTVDYYAGKVLSSLLNNSAHPFKAGFSKQVSIYDFETESFLLHTQSFFAITCIVPPDQLQKSYDSLNIRLSKINQYLRDDIQLADARRRTYQYYESITRSTGEYLNTLGLFWANDLLNEYYQAQQIIMKLTATDLQNFVTRYIYNKPSARFLLISPAHQDASQSRRFFNSFESPDDMTLYFDRNQDQISQDSEINFYKAVQFLKINPGISIEITIFQDAEEKKDLVRKRYVYLYRRLYAEGISEQILDELNVNLYVANAKSVTDKFLNQRVVFNRTK